MAEHTKGPWGRSHIGPYVIAAANGEHVARALTTHNPAKQPANAHLIAAAPEMYEALEALVAFEDPDSKYDQEQDARLRLERERHVDAARAALAAARGEEREG